MALFVPFPPPNASEMAALLRLLAFAGLAVAALVTLSTRPRIGRILTIVIGIAAFAQLILVVGRIPGAPFPLSTAELILATAPWLMLVLALVMVIRLPRNTDVAQRDA